LTTVRSATGVKS